MRLQRKSVLDRKCLTIFNHSFNNNILKIMLKDRNFNGCILSKVCLKLYAFKLWNLDLKKRTYYTLSSNFLLLFNTKKFLWFYYLDGSRVLTCSVDEHIKVLDIATEQEVFTKDMQTSIRYIFHFAFVFGLFFFFFCEKKNI